MKMRRATILLALIICITATAADAGQRIPMPGGLFYYRPAASVFGPEAVWTNPAGLGRYKAHSWQVMFDYDQGDFAKSWGTASTGEQVGFAYRHIYRPDEQDFNEYVLAFGSGFGGSYNFGASYRYFKDGPDFYNKRHFWSVGIMNQLQGPFGWAALFSNLNRGRIDGERTETEQRYSITYQAVPDKITLSADMFLSTKTRLSNAEFAYQVEISPKAGLYLTGYYDSEDNIQVGVKANLARYFIGTDSRTDNDGNDKGNTLYMGSTTHLQPSLIRYPGKRLAVGVGGSIPENPVRPVFGRKRDGFADLVLTVYRAAEDPMIKEMSLALRPADLGFGRASELREAIRYFRSRDKKVICHISYPNNLTYYVGAAADEIYIAPVSQLNLVGLRAELKFYGGSLAKLGIRADMVRIGDYKTAPEQYTQTAATEENRAQINRILDNLYEQFVDGIARGRELSIDSVTALIDNGPYTSEDAVAAGLVDGLSYRDNMRKDILSSLPEISFHRYKNDTLSNSRFEQSPLIAVVVADGEIENSSGRMNPLDNSKATTPSAMKAAFAAASSNPRVQGVVFRVNSPGGFALAAEEIFHEADKAGKKLPMVVSMANIAASGGYHIAMPATKLFANPTSVTGSIGIYGGKLDLSGLYDKIEMGTELYTRGRFAGMLTDTRGFSDEEREKYYSQLEAFYNYFVELVADNRALTVDSVDALSRGRVWTGLEALRNGLVDELGGLKSAIDYLADQLQLSDYRVEVYPQRRPWIVFPARPLLGLAASVFGTGSDAVAAVEGISDIKQREGHLMTRLPYDLIIE
ncbi:MAG: signal peptide peptidase SppA [bacterium]|nr:signal peptide peptidase SppA [bacterium]